MTTDRQELAIEAASHLAQHDLVLAPIIDRFGPYPIKPHNNYYRELVDSIISQQLSVKAAVTISKRFLDLFDGSFPTPQEILEKDIDELRTVGMSRAKAMYVRDLAQHIIDGTLELDKIVTLSNDKVIEELTAIKGIGEWTAHMFLIFSVGRLDVLATGDQGVRAAIMKLYHLTTLPSAQQIRELAARHHWHPYESIVCWYLWQSLDNTPKQEAV